MEREEHGGGDEFRHPVVAYAFAIVEYLKTTNPEIYKRAVEYAEDLTGIELEGFELEEVEKDEIEEVDEENEQNEDDEFYG
jgi:hypothetical protein